MKNLIALVTFSILAGGIVGCHHDKEVVYDHRVDHDRDWHDHDRDWHDHNDHNDHGDHGDHHDEDRH